MRLKMIYPIGSMNWANLSELHGNWFKKSSKWWLWIVLKRTVGLYRFVYVGLFAQWVYCAFCPFQNILAMTMLTPLVTVHNIRFPIQASFQYVVFQEEHESQCSAQGLSRKAYATFALWAF